MVEDFVKLFEPKDYEGRILKVLNREIAEKRAQREERERQKEFMKHLTLQILS
jgi:2'-5' RNA ligase